MSNEELAARLAAIEEKLDQVLEFRDLLITVAGAKLGKVRLATMLARAGKGSD